MLPPENPVSDLPPEYAIGVWRVQLLLVHLVCPALPDACKGDREWFLATAPNGQENEPGPGHLPTDDKRERKRLQTKDFVQNTWVAATQEDRTGSTVGRRPCFQLDDGSDPGQATQATMPVR